MNKTTINLYETSGMHIPFEVKINKFVWIRLGNTRLHLTSHDLKHLIEALKRDSINRITFAYNPHRNSDSTIRNMYFEDSRLIELAHDNGYELLDFSIPTANLIIATLEFYGVLLDYRINK